MGFTLIEMLVVIVIIGIVVSMATLSIGVLGRDSQVEDQARRLWAVLQQAREEAELQSVTVGVYLSAGKYEFLRMDQRRNFWVPILDDKLYRTRELEDDLRLRLWLDGREVILKADLPERTDEDQDEDSEGEPEENDADKEDESLHTALRTIDRDEPLKPQADPPQLAILSSGDIMPFELHLERDREAALWRVVGTAENDLRVERRGERQEWEIVAQTNPPPDEVAANARK